MNPTEVVIGKVQVTIWWCGEMRVAGPPGLDPGSQGYEPSRFVPLTYGPVMGTPRSEKRPFRLGGDLLLLRIRGILLFLPFLLKRRKDLKLAHYRAGERFDKRGGVC